MLLLENISVIRLSKKENILYLGSMDKNIRIWDIKNRKEIGIIGKHYGFVTTICLSKNENILYSGSIDNTIRIWDLKNIKEISIGKHYGWANEKRLIKTN